MKISGGVDDILGIQQEQRIQLALLHFLLDLCDLVLIPVWLKPVVRWRALHSGIYPQPPHRPETGHIRAYGQCRRCRQRTQELPPVCVAQCNLLYPILLCEKAVNHNALKLPELCVSTRSTSKFESSSRRFGASAVYVHLGNGLPWQVDSDRPLRKSGFLD